MENKDCNYNSYSELPKDGSPSKPSWLKKGKENKELKILKKMKSIKEKNSTPEKSSPERFRGDGVSFRAKIIGIEQVIDARGNRMCQGALQRLKAAAKTAGDHKQRIIINISLDGIIIKDEKTGEQLHHHPIHKISFISQDTKDSRAFGYVHGCPQTGHEFFAIKTEKAASQIVVTLRDLFLVALDLKKAELEKTQNHQEAKIQSNGNSDLEKENLDESPEIIRFPHEESSRLGLGSSVMYSNIVILPEESEVTYSDAVKPEVNEQTSNLQSELDTLQESISHMDHSIAVSESLRSDFEGEFSPIPGKLHSLYQETLSLSSATSEDTIPPPEAPSKDVPSALLERGVSGISSLSTCSSSSMAEDTDVQSATSASACSADAEDRYAVFLNIDSMPSIFDDPSIAGISKSEKMLNDKFESPEKNTSALSSSDPFNAAEKMEGQRKDSSASEKENDQIKPLCVAFAELDPLGNQPYVDKRDFFQGLKQPPKKVLKDLAGSDAFCEFRSSQENVKFANFDAFNAEESFEAVESPPKLPPKRCVGSIPGELRMDTNLKNPFNPFLAQDAFDVPPPSISPPPPPPRTIGDSSESPAFASPPPRPPSRVGAIPTPPLPRRKAPLSHANQAWFSFDQDASCLPPLPSPARKVSISRPESHFQNPPPVFSAKGDLDGKAPIADAESAVFGVENLPPIPPKPLSIVNSVRKQESSSSGMSVIESSSGTRSSSSLVFSSVDEHSGGTSSEALFSSSNYSEVFSDSGKESQWKNDASPDSIFRRKSDPFADDFFLSLNNKSCDFSSQTTNNSEKAPT